MGGNRGPGVAPTFPQAHANPGQRWQWARDICPAPTLPAQGCAGPTRDRGSPQVHVQLAGACLLPHTTAHRHRSDGHSPEGGPHPTPAPQVFSRLRTTVPAADPPTVPFPWQRPIASGSSPSEAQPSYPLATALPGDTLPGEFRNTSKSFNILCASRSINSVSGRRSSLNNQRS